MVDVRYYTQMYEEFALCFPSIASKAVDSYPSGQYTITVVLSDKSKVVYDTNTRTIRTLRTDWFHEMLTEAETDARKEFANKLLKLMRERRITQKELSTRTGISQSMISKYLNAVSEPSITNAAKIARVLECSLDEFLYQ